MPNAATVLGITIEERDRLRAELQRLEGAIKRRIEELTFYLERSRDPIVIERNRFAIAELRKLIEPKE